MKPLKVKIDKRLNTIKSSDLKIYDKQVTDDIKFLNKGLASSVMFRNVSASVQDRMDLIKHLESDKVIDFSRMPFNDIFFLAPLELHEDDDPNHQAEIIEDGMLLRISKGRFVGDVIFVSSYVYSRRGDCYISTNFQLLHPETNSCRVAGGSKMWHEHFSKLDTDQSLDERLMAVAFKEAIHAIAILKNIIKFEPIKTEGVLTSSEKRHVPSGLVDKYIEYTLDLTKANRKRFYKTKPHQGGSHESPCEHRRRGHERVLKSGKTCWVKGSIVNEGSKTGKVEKDYAM